MTTSDDLHRIIIQRENTQVDFKSEASEEVLRGLSTDIAAFSNTQGGLIVFGVTDDGDPKGCDLSRQQRDRISQEASKCQPVVQIDLEEVPFGARKFVVVKVPKRRVIHNDGQRRFPVRIGNITDYLDALGLVTLLQERSLLRGDNAAQGWTPSEIKREPLPEGESSTLAKMVTSNDTTIRLEALRDLAVMPFRHVLLEYESMADAVGQILANGDEEAVTLLLDFLRGIGYSGSEKEKSVLKGWIPRIVEIARPSAPPELARKAFDVLQSIRSRQAVEILTLWIREADDNKYAGLQPNNVILNLAYFGLKGRAREAMHELLESKPDERTRKRVIEVLEALRKSPG